VAKATKPQRRHHSFTHLLHSAAGQSHSWRIQNASLLQWERVTQWPLVVAAFLFLAAYAIPIIWPQIDHWLLNYTNHIVIATWVLFGIDYVARLTLAKDKATFFRHNIVDLLSIVLPLFRPLRLLRLVAAISVLNRVGVMTLRWKVISYAITFAAVITFAGALTVTQAERAAGGNITSFGNGLWWAFVTISSVGYGDFYPITFIGRLVAIVLMITGVLLIGAISASLASWMVEHTILRPAAANESVKADSNKASSETSMPVIEAVTKS